MFIFVLFLISLVLILFIFAVKGIEAHYSKTIFLTKLLAKGDNFILENLQKSKQILSHINLKNLGLIFSWIIVSISKLIIRVKRHFDHKQAHFFLKKDIDGSKDKAPVSFFLKNVSDYKKSLEENAEIK